MNTDRKSKQNPGPCFMALIGVYPRHLWFLSLWSGRRDSNSRSEFGRLACFQLHHFRIFGVRRQSEATTALWIEGEDC